MLVVRANLPGSAAAEKVPFPHLVGQELAGESSWEGSGGTRAEVESGVKSVGGAGMGEAEEPPAPATSVPEGRGQRSGLF